MAVFAVSAVLTPFAFFTDWPTPEIFLLVDTVSLAAWGQAVQMRSGLNPRRTVEWLLVLVALMALLLVAFVIVRFGAQLLGQGLVAVIGYVLIVLAVLTGFGWVMGDQRRARAFLALRRAMMGRGTAEDVAILDRGPGAYR